MNLNVKKKAGGRDFCVNKFIEFCKRTDLHGYKYVVMQELNYAERTCWALAILFSIALAAYFVVLAYNWYARNPIVTVIESTHGPIWDVPFPAVIICDLNLVSRKAARIFSDDVKLPANVTANDVFETLRYAPFLNAPFFVDEEMTQRLYILQDVLDLNNVDPKNLFEKIGPSASSCSDIVQRCMWKNTIFRCEQLFHRLFTHFSVCCAFNYFATDIPEIVSSKDPYMSRNPRRVATCGYQTALTVLINIDPTDYYSTSTASHGALVLVDNAYNVPDVNSPARLVNLNTEVFIALSPERTYTTSGVRSFGIDVRQCLYADEMKINNFRYYSYHNCLAYERVLDIINRCGCAPYYFTLKEEVRLCNFRDIDCLKNIKRPYEEHERKDMEHVALQCLPDCEHYDYPLEVAMGVLTERAPINGLTFFKDIEFRNHSLINVFFSDLVSTRYRRDVYLNWQNLLASFGGLLSLMLGFTLISGFDFIIFFTFRIAHDWFTSEKGKNKHHKSITRNRVFAEGHLKRNNWTRYSKRTKMTTNENSSERWLPPPSYYDTIRMRY